MKAELGTRLVMYYIANPLVTPGKQKVSLKVVKTLHLLKHMANVKS